MFNKSSKPQNRIDSLIGATTRIEGNVIFSGGLRVDGMVRGNVGALPDQPSTLVISSDARIDGEVQAAHIVVNGTIFGPAAATEKRTIAAGTAAARPRATAGRSATGSGLRSGSRWNSR